MNSKSSVLLEAGLLLVSFCFGLVATIVAQSWQSFFQLSMLFGIALSFITSFSFTYALSRKTDQPRPFTIVGLYRAILAGVLVFGFLISVPTTVDRSFSVWALNAIYKADVSHSIAESDLREKMASFFDKDSGEVARRIAEQEIVGNFELEGGFVFLTEQGERSRSFFKWVSELFRLNPKYAQ